MKLIPLIIMGLVTPMITCGESEAVKSPLKTMRVADPITYRNLKIFPLTMKNMSSTDYITLDKAMKSNWLKIREIGEGEVNWVELKNTGDKVVFIMTGEMLSGAKQDRMLREDVLVPRNSGWIRVPVYCVEHGRWVSVSSDFKSAKEVAPNQLRQRARITEDQSEIWNAIAVSQDRLGIASGTRTVQANYEDERIKKELEEYTLHFGELPRLTKNTVGVIVTAGERIICVDVFANNALLSEFWSKLLRSYIMDAIMINEPVVAKKDVEALIDELNNARYTSIGTPGLGDLFKIAATAGKGNVLVHKGTVIHMDFFIDEFQDEGDAEWRLDLRRDQRLND